MMNDEWRAGSPFHSENLSGQKCHHIFKRGLNQWANNGSLQMELIDVQANVALSE